MISLQKFTDQCKQLGLKGEAFNKLMEYLSSDADYESLIEKMSRVALIYEKETGNPLVWLCLAGEFASIYNYLHAHRLNVQHADASKRGIVHYLAWSGNINSLLDYLEVNPDCAENKDIFGRSIVHYLAWSGNLAALEQYLEKFPSQIQARDKLQRSIVHYLAWSGNETALQLFLNAHVEFCNDIDKMNETFGVYLRKSGGITTEQQIKKTAIIMALPGLTKLIVEKSDEKAFLILENFAKERIPGAVEAFTTVQAELECKRIRRRIDNKRVTDTDIMNLQQYALQQIPGAEKLLDQYWWDRSMGVQNNVEELTALLNLTPFAHLRLAEHYLKLSETAPGLRTYGYGLGLFYSPTNEKGDLLNKCKPHLDAAEKHQLIEVHYLLGKWHLENQQLHQACQHFGKALLNRTTHWAEALVALKDIMDAKNTPPQITCLSRVLQWRFNKKTENLANALEKTKNEFIQFACAQTDCSAAESILLLTFAIAKNENVLPILLNHLAKHVSVTVAEAVEFVSQTKEFFAEAEQSAQFIEWALPIAKDDAFPIHYRAALTKQLLTLRVDRADFFLLQEFWESLDSTIRIDINLLVPLSEEPSIPAASSSEVISASASTTDATALDSQSAAETSAFDIQLADEGLTDLLVATFTPAVAAPAPSVSRHDDDNDDDDDFNSRWDCRN